MRELLAVLFLWYLPIVCCAQSQSAQMVLRETFEEDSLGSVGRSLLEHERISLAKGAGKDGSDAIRVAYTGSDRGSERVVDRFDLGVSAEHATLSFDVFFEQGFQWGLGGKLHGLGPANPVTGGQPRSPEQWSARAMFKEDGRCATYLYDQHPQKKYGVVNQSTDPVFSAGQWHYVEIETALNEAGKANGYSVIRVDGQEVVRTEGVMFRGTDTSETAIQQFLFSTFHGGNSPKFAPVDDDGEYTTVYALFDNFEVVVVDD